MTKEEKKIYDKIYYLKNRSKKLLYNKNYRKNNKKFCSDIRKKWRAKNKKKDNSYKKTYYKNNREKCLLLSKIWANKNRKKVRAIIYKYRSKPINKIKTKAHATVLRALKNRILKKPLKCEQCKKKHNRLHGHHEDYNKPLKVKWLCPSCHHMYHGIFNHFPDLKK
jgi:hypothetical protein